MSVSEVHLTEGEVPSLNLKKEAVAHGQHLKPKAMGVPIIFGGYN